MNGAEGCELGGADLGVVGEQEKAAGAVPECLKGLFGLEDGWGVRPEAAEPWAVDAAVYEVDGLAGVEEQGGGGGQFAVDEDEVAGAGGDLLGFEDDVGQVLGAENGVEADESLMCREEDDDHAGG